MPWKQHWREDLFGKFPVDWNDVVDLFLPQLERPSDERENISSRFKIKNLIEDRSVYDSLVYCVNIRHFDKDIPAELQTGPWTYNFNSLQQTAPLQTAEMDDVRFVRLKGLNGFDLAYKDPDNIKRHNVNGNVFFEPNDHDATGFYAVIVKLRFESKVVTVIRFAFMVFGSTVDESIDSLPSKVDGRWLFPFRFLLNRPEYFKEAETHGISDYVLNSVSLMVGNTRTLYLTTNEDNKKLHFFTAVSVLWYGHLENSNVLFNQIYFTTTQSFKRCIFGYVEPILDSDELVNFKYTFPSRSIPPFISLDSVMGKGCMGLFTSKTNFQPHTRPYRFSFMDKNFSDSEANGKEFHAIFSPEYLWVIWDKIRTGVPYIYMFCNSIVNSSQIYVIRVNDNTPVFKYTRTLPHDPRIVESRFSLSEYGGFDLSNKRHYNIVGFLNAWKNSESYRGRENSFVDTECHYLRVLEGIDIDEIIMADPKRIRREFLNYLGHMVFNTEVPMKAHLACSEFDGGNGTLVYMLNSVPIYAQDIINPLEIYIGRGNTVYFRAQNKPFYILDQVMYPLKYDIDTYAPIDSDPYLRIVDSKSSTIWHDLPTIGSFISAFNKVHMLSVTITLINKIPYLPNHEEMAYSNWDLVNGKHFSSLTVSSQYRVPHYNLNYNFGQTKEHKIHFKIFAFKVNKKVSYPARGMFRNIFPPQDAINFINKTGNWKVNVSSEPIPKTDIKFPYIDKWEWWTYQRKIKYVGSSYMMPFGPAGTYTDMSNVIRDIQTYSPLPMGESFISAKPDTSKRTIDSSSGSGGANSGTPTEPGSGDGSTAPDNGGGSPTTPTEPNIGGGVLA